MLAGQTGKKHGAHIWSTFDSLLPTRTIISQVVIPKGKSDRPTELLKNMIAWTQCYNSFFLAHLTVPSALNSGIPQSLR